MEKYWVIVSASLAVLGFIAIFIGAYLKEKQLRRKCAELSLLFFFLQEKIYETNILCRDSESKASKLLMSQAMEELVRLSIILRGILREEHPSSEIIKTCGMLITSVKKLESKVETLEEYLKAEKPENFQEMVPFKAS